jgi:hypothetical protein
MDKTRVKGGPGIPETARYNYNYNDRHIINDAFNKILWIQVLHDYMGQLNMEEYTRIKAGLFWEYLPKHIIQDVHAMVDAGYRVMPSWINGMNTGNGFIVYQLAALKTEEPALMAAKGFNPNA